MTCLHNFRFADLASFIAGRTCPAQVPFVIYSGYDEVEAWVGAPVVRKPAVRQHLMQTVSNLLD